MTDLQKELKSKEENSSRLRQEYEALKQDQTSHHLKSVIQSLEEEI